DGKAEAEAAIAFARQIVELMELLENRSELPFRNAGTGVPNLDAQRVAAPAAAQQHLAVSGVFHGVRQQIPQHLLEQALIAAHEETAGDDTPVEAVRRRMIG